MRNEFLVFIFLSLGITLLSAYFFWPPMIWLLAVLMPVIILGIYDMVQSRHTVMRNFPVLGRGRYVLEELRPKLYQYFIESDTNGRPINRIYRSVVYQRAKKVRDTTPFGTQLDLYEEGYEWLNHSIAAKDAHDLDQDPRVTVGNAACRQPYAASLLNVSAMSFGSLSKNAIMALNGGAEMGRFAHNTGEGGISSYHVRHNGDLIYQFGTGYFGCRTPDGQFSPEAFTARVASDQIKMIEVKLSQGAKPGHGGILPAAKNTPEIAEIRGVPVGTSVLSPPSHKVFSTPEGLVRFIGQLRELSGGKPVGFKLCIGSRSEFMAICKAMIEADTYPDFIAIDGGEGGTGAAPPEFSNSVGMPFVEGLATAYDILQGFGIKEHIKLFASGKILTGYHIFRALALGADACYSARAMMLALGCIQALECNKNNCPTGVATQRPELVQGLVVSDKKVRVANFQQETIKNFVELLGAAGLDHPDQITRHHIYRRVSMQKVMRYSELFPELPEGCLRTAATVPDDWQLDWQLARPDRF
ncbi:MAG: FMN-binding glutamate synthase family protein [Phaeodactylibacter sp.]|uniref:FMN-binding glutamate synthase family protein n=1 Tax=Phaeodactylibacter sp. TaxID=1940289 RepID=UPI0032ED1D9C